MLTLSETLNSTADFGTTTAAEGDDSGDGLGRGARVICRSALAYVVFAAGEHAGGASGVETGGRSAGRSRDCGYVDDICGRMRTPEETETYVNLHCCVRRRNVDNRSPDTLSPPASNTRLLHQEMAAD